MNRGAMTPATVYIWHEMEQYRTKNRIWQGIPGIERTAKGTLFAAWYSGGKTEEAGNVVVVERSADDGKTWTDGFVLVRHDDENVRCFDEVLWIDPQGRLWIFWAQAYLKNDERNGVWGCYTEDAEADAPRFSEPVRVGHGVMMCRPTVASDGTWYMPCSLWPSDFCKASERHPELDTMRTANVYASVNAGKTFEYRGGADGAQRSCDEHMIVEKKDGRLWMLTRTKYGIGQAFSEDKGYTWTDILPSGHIGPNARFFIRRLKSGKLLMVNHVNPTYTTDPKKWHVRNNLMAMLSEDDGKTWHGGLMLDTRDEISYPDGIQAEDGRIYLIYDRSRYEAKEILMAVFTEEDVMEGRLVSEGSRIRKLVNRAESEEITPRNMR